MVLIGLLLIALICLALGLVLPSAAWLIASLIASGGAGYLVIRARQALRAGKPARARRAATSRASSASATPAAAGDAAADAPAGGPASGLDSGPDSALDSDAPRAAAQVAPAAATSAAPDEVWVIDGRPRYHLADCAIIQGQDAEPIPFEQATEDGFMACSLCEPNVLRSAS